ncbi:MAG: P-loop NTPase fold protein [Candidatus Contendobacter sp.]
MPEPKPLHDLPTLDDKLNWNSELERLSERIQHCQPPHVLGIHGDWGSGKTSFMRQLQCRLGGEPPREDGSVSCPNGFALSPAQKILQDTIATIWFDAWRYQHEPAPVVALLQEMRRQMAGLPVVVEKFKKFGTIALRYTLNSLSDVGKAIGFEGLPSAEKIEKLGERWEKEHLAESLPTDSIRGRLHETIKCLLPDEAARVVVFIDDLDRCNPKAAFRLLEGLKIYLSIPNCVFVLGMNERILVDAIREEVSAPKETSVDELRLRASHYLEKICTDIHRLPLPPAPAQLLTAWLGGMGQQQALVAAIEKIRCLPPNPRRLKALANQWARFAGYVAFPTEDQQRNIWAVRVLVVAYIHQFHRDLWERWHFNPEFWNEIKAWCMGEREKPSSESSQGVPAERTALRGPDWTGALKLIDKVESWDTESRPIWKLGFVNPGDIEIFWISSLIREHADLLVADDFIPLLKGPGAAL